MAWLLKSDVDKSLKSIIKYGMRSILLTMVLGCGALFAVIAFAIAAHGVGLWTTGVAEGSFIEVASAWLYFMTATAAVMVAQHEKTKRWAVYAIIMLAAGARELDLHKQWTSQSIFKSRFYLSHETPIGEKLIGLAVIALLVLCAIYALRRVPDMWRKLRADEGCYPLLLSAIGLLVCAKFFDGFFRYFDNLAFIMSWSVSHRAHFSIIEEVLEFVASVLFLSFLVLSVRRVRLMDVVPELSCKQSCPS